jgi:hypothetical protein
MFRKRYLLLNLTITLAAGVVFALSGAFRTEIADLPFRLAYWVSIMLVAGLWGHLCFTLIQRKVTIQDRPWVAVIGLSLCVAVPMTCVVWLFTGLAFEGALYPLAKLTDLIVPVLTVTIPLSTLSIFLPRALITPARHDDGGPARFNERLPLRFRGATVWAVEAQDHYLKVYTDRGSTLLLMRLSDAILELQGIEGARTHRSWWVGKATVRDVIRRRRGALLVLDDDIQVPVSRRYLPYLRRAGWL